MIRVIKSRVSLHFVSLITAFFVLWHKAIQVQQQGRPLTLIWTHACDFSVWKSDVFKG